MSENVQSKTSIEGQNYLCCNDYQISNEYYKCMHSAYTRFRKIIGFHKFKKKIIIFYFKNYIIVTVASIILK